MYKLSITEHIYFFNSLYASQIRYPLGDLIYQTNDLIALLVYQFPIEPIRSSSFTIIVIKFLWYYIIQCLTLRASSSLYRRMFNTPSLRGTRVKLI